MDRDSLVRAGQPGVQLTWMDAKVGDWVVTPRIGKPVEVQALWVNALRIVGASPSCERDYRSIHYSFPFVLLMGSEGSGLAAEHLAVCAHVVRIPMAGRCDSLNLAVATGVILYEAFHQRDKG